MPRDPAQSADRRGAPASAGPAVEDHGRVVTTTIEAAGFYRRAQQARDSSRAVTALRLAVKADPDFAVAIADLDALTDAHPSPTGGRQMNWERHHIEVVRTAAAGNVSRAADLLREHLASVGCDPLAVRIVADLGRRMGNQGGLEDLSGERSACHSDARRSGPDWQGGL